MCGIAGAVTHLAQVTGDGAWSGEVVKNCVARVTNAMQHRGPDGHGLWANETGDVVFGHRRLAILDLTEAGAQPMVDSASGCAITFNGEVYNFSLLRRELQALGECFNSSSDTEVVLKAYKHWGLGAIPKFRGIFAMAIWDPRSRAVHLVRDQLGVKPLYWTIVRDGQLGKGTLLFASEVRALLASGAVQRRLDPAGVASYLAQGFVVGPTTIVDGINLLPAACTLTIAPDHAEADLSTPSVRRYWTLPSNETANFTPDELRKELSDTVRMQLVSDAPLGVFLSGGIDSSAVAALACEEEPGSIHTFTIGFEDSDLDESRYAAQVAAALQTRHANVLLHEDDFVKQLPDALSAIDQPTFDALNTYFVSRAAREAGMTVALAGTGGDELFGGYSSFVDVPKALRYTSLIPRHGLDGVVQTAARLACGVLWESLGRAPPQVRWAKIADVACAAHDLLAMYQVSYELFTKETQARLASLEVRKAQSSLEYGLPAAVAESWRERIEGSDGLHAISLLELSSFIGERLLRDTDAASMAVGLEVRVPLLDHVLCQTVAGIETKRRFDPLRKKQLLREIALARLDPSLFDRPKAGFVLPIHRWARSTLQAEMQLLLSDSELIRRVGLRPETVGTLWESYVAGRPGLHWSRLWSLYVLLAWCRSHDMSLAS